LGEREKKAKKEWEEANTKKTKRKKGKRLNFKKER
jgi:hypothetical protein